MLEIHSLVISTPTGRRLFGVESATIGPGLTAVVGPNGAGKSTWLRTLVGLAPLSGSITLNGVDAVRQRRVFLADVAYQPQNFAAYPEMNGYEFLAYFLQLRGYGRQVSKERAAMWMDIVGLTDRTERCGAYSQGMLQRLGLAYALQTEARLCVLDEPFAGVDPDARRRLSDLLKAEARERVILVCTHHVEEMIERDAHVATIQDGTFALSDN